MYKKDFGNIPNKDKIIYYLIENNKRNKKLAERSFSIGNMAKKIAGEIDLDKDIAFATGCLFDIGKTEEEDPGKSLIKGYQILRKDSYFFPARIAISHAFVTKDVEDSLIISDLDEKDIHFLKNFLFQISYNDYDRLIQVLDGGFYENSYMGILEKNEISKSYDKEALEKLINLEEYFEKKLGKKLISY